MQEVPASAATDVENAVAAAYFKCSRGILPRILRNKEQPIELRHEMYNTIILPAALRPQSTH